MARVNTAVCSVVSVGITLPILLNTAFYATARVNATRFSAVGVGAMLPILLLLVPPFTLPSGLMLPVFGRWSRRYVAHFNVVGAYFHTTAMVTAARFSAVDVGVILPISPLLVPPFSLWLG